MAVQQIERRFVRPSDYRFTAHIWVRKGPHLHATGRTKLQALENVDAKLASYLACYGHTLGATS